MTRYVCVHGHFYQPPRENPWLETIALQDEAYPYHDWNERITAECYAPNADARILDERGRIVRIVNNYARMSFNIGPTLLAWMFDHARETHDAIVAADRDSMVRFSGHGSALAQAYNHIIMPLATERDRRTQVIWGIRDFRNRFGREPEGMWLPETAVNTASLEALAENGIAFTILAPHQAESVLPPGTAAWQSVAPDRVDTSRPYLCELPSGRTITLFFYDGPVSRAVAFEGILKNGDRFAHRLHDIFHPGDEPQLAHIATDGESYGHHHRHGEMALAYALAQIEQSAQTRLTNYGEFLARHPATWRARIVENSSWSCAHGIERWRSDCGCHTGGGPGWHQRWRAPLRAALDWLRNSIDNPFEDAAAGLVRDPWAARDDYIDVVLDRSPAAVHAFIARHAPEELAHDDIVRTLKLFEMQRNAMLMYTSCGWFFNEVSGIETVQVLQYAARVIQLAQEVFQLDLEPEFLELLDLAPSNVPSVETARRLYEESVRPAKVDLFAVAAHYAVSSLFGETPAEADVYAYHVTPEHHEQRRSGDATLGVGRARVVSNITWESTTVTFALLHFGSHSLSGGIRRFAGSQEYESLVEQMLRSFSNADLSAVIRLLAEFPEYSFSLKSLFTDRQRVILYQLLDSSLRDAEDAYRRLYRENSALIRFLANLDLPLPRAFTIAAEFVLNRDLRAVFAQDRVDLERARGLIAEARALGITVDSGGIGYMVERALERLAAAFYEQPEDTARLEQLADVATVAGTLPFSIDLWKTQNIFYASMREVYPRLQERAEQGDADSIRALPLVQSVGELLSVAVP